LNRVHAGVGQYNTYHHRNPAARQELQESGLHAWAKIHMRSEAQQEQRC